MYLLKVELKTKKRSFKKMLNSSGPNIEPSGTPVILSSSLKFLFTLTICFLFIKLLFVYIKASVSNPTLAINKS